MGKFKVVRRTAEERSHDGQEREVKTGVNKEFDQPNKSKKGRSTSNRRKREEILEIPVLPENTSNDQQAKEARDIFFYDIPKYWNEDDAKIALNKNFEKTFVDGHFGICISKNFIRWYDAKLDLKGRQERDQWQTVRDLTNEEMESIKKGNTYDFTKKLQQTSKMAFIKIIKITQNWKVIGYFKNLKEMEEAVEDSCTQGDINRVWLVRNKKTIYKDGDAKTKATTKAQEKKFKEKVTATENRMSSPIRLAKSLQHPSKAEQPSRTSKTPDENEVVEMIKNWRVGEENTLDQKDTSENKGQQLKKDNVVPEEVVEIIKDYRTTNKIKYVQYQESTHDGSLVDKLKEVKEIFNQTSNKMEWEKINVEAVDELRKEHGIRNWNEAKNWALEKNNFFRLGQKIIKSLSKWSDIEDEEERNKAFKAFYLEKRQRELIQSPSVKEDNEENEEAEEEEEELEPETSPSKKNGGKKKKKKKNNKK
uniref:Uncharacterized protein n=1 Tax=Rhizophagus irregularis (strain DAOM 181602 / DAOM 197198 / MUCL 43194) TaxID=747089 RepID=U9UEH9_RHIID